MFLNFVCHWFNKAILKNEFTASWIQMLIILLQYCKVQSMPERKLSYLHGVTNTVEGVGQIMLYLAPSSSPSWPLAVYHSWPHGSPFSLSFPHPFLLYGVYISLSTRDLTSFRYFVMKQQYIIVVHSTKLNVFCSLTLICFLANKVALFFLSVLPDFLSWGRNEKVRR